MPTHHISIKFCGITCVDDAKACVDLGVDAIGLNFYSASPRFISIEKAQAILAVIPASMSVYGLFCHDELSDVENTVKQLNLTGLQFHGNISNQQCRQYGLPFLKAIQMTPGCDVEQHMRAYPDAKHFILDAAFSGSGKVFDWSQIPKQLPKKIILAGGLTPDNVTQAIEQVRPFAVDVSSGIESQPGKKSIEKMKAFIAAVNKVKS